MKQKLFAFFAAAMLLLGMSACTTEDNPSSGEEGKTVIPAQLKQGIWTEYDEALLTSGKYTEEQLAAMPSVGMQIDGDKAYFFTYTADDASEPVEGKISYNKSTGEGTITFPAIKDNPLSGQKVNFTATSDETMEFDLTYEGQKTTANFAWLCENLDNWSSDITDEDWKELMAYYQTIDADWGPDASIDWGDAAKPLVWDDDAVAPAGTRAIGVATVVKLGLNLFSSLFKEDPSEKVNEKLDAVIKKVDAVLANQKEIKEKINEVNDRLNTITNIITDQETTTIFNNRNEKFVNKLDAQDGVFNVAYKYYTQNKGNQTDEVKNKLGAYAKKWVGSGNEYIKLTWEYIIFLTSVKHSVYHTEGMDQLYDRLTFNKYPWEHMGTGDRQCYRANDMYLITKCLFMICLYYTYGADEIDKEMLDEDYPGYEEKLRAFCEFEVTDSKEFLVCQIPGAHFVMRKQLQKYNYYGKDGKSPLSELSPFTHLSPDAAYRPEWREDGEPKIDNPQEVKEKLIRTTEMKSIHQYYQALYKQEKIWWMKIFVDGAEMPAGAVYSKAPSGVKDNKPCLLMYYQERPHQTGLRKDTGSSIVLEPVMQDWQGGSWVYVGSMHLFSSNTNWATYNSNQEYYVAIVEQRY